MTDVARLAGVSHQTVSRVVNDHPRVLPQTRLRVRAAMDELGYRPNRAAQALVRGRSATIGVVAQNATTYGPASLLAAVEQAAAGTRFGVGLTSVRSLDDDSIADAVRRHLDQQVAGVVLIAPVESAAGALDVVPGDVPLVCIDGDPRRATPSVTVDNALGAQLATEHLLSLGHRAVWHVAGPADWFDSAARVAGWRAALADAGVEPPPALRADWSCDGGYRAGQVLARTPEVTAVLTANDHLALGVLRAMREAGRDVPGEVSVVGVDDIPEAPYVTPALTTVRQDFAGVAREAWHLLAAQLDGGAVPRRRVLIEPTLVVRDSTAPPPPAVRTGHRRRAAARVAAAHQPSRQVRSVTVRSATVRSVTR